jgi:hypothetical protein
MLMVEARCVFEAVYRITEMINLAQQARSAFPFSGAITEML